MQQKKQVIITIDAQQCKGCELCVRACPKNIIELSKNKLNANGYHSAEIIDIEQCIACKACAINCPDVCIEIAR